MDIRLSRRLPHISESCLSQHASTAVLKRTEQNLIVCVSKSEARVTSSKRLCLRYCTVEAKYRETKALDGLSAIAELLVFECGDECGCYC